MMRSPRLSAWISAEALKKQAFVLEVGKELKRRGHRVKLLFAGRARDEDQAYVEELHRLVAKLDLHEEAVFLGQRSDVPNLLQVLDVVMIPSPFEGFPLIGLESAAAGVPSVVCNAAGAEEFARVSGSGIAFCEDSVTDAADKVEQVTAAPEEYIRKGKAFARLCTHEEYQKRMSVLFETVR